LARSLLQPSTAFGASKAEGGFCVVRRLGWRAVCFEYCGVDSLDLGADSPQPVDFPHLREVVTVSTPTQPVAPHRADEPTILWKRVVKARAVVAKQRHLPLSRSHSLARAELLSALEDYVASLTNHGRPIPYGLRDELQIRRLTRHECR